MTRFAVIGLGNTVIDLGVFTFAYKVLELPLVGSNVLAWLVAVSGSYSPVFAGALGFTQMIYTASTTTLKQTAGTLEVALVLDRLATNGWLAGHGVLVLERAAKTAEQTLPDGLTMIRSRRYGDTMTHWIGWTQAWD